MRGPWSFTFAYLPSSEAVLEQAEAYRLPFLTAAGVGPRDELTSHVGPGLSGESVALTSLRRRNGEIEARVVNEQDEAQTIVFDGRKVDLRPWEIRTLAAARQGAAGETDRR